MSQPVNRPMDTKQRDRDIESKLHLFGIYQGFKNGKLPSNKQCDIAINSLLASKVFSSPPKDLSEEGQILVKDLRNAIEQAQMLILSKNEGQILQEFIWGAKSFDTYRVKKSSIPTDKVFSKQDARQAGNNLKLLGSLVVTNGEFRKLLSDASIIIRDMIGDATQEAASKVRPSQEQLAQVDQPAPENVWHEKPDTGALKSRTKDSMGRARGAVDEGRSGIASTTKRVSEGEEEPNDINRRVKEVVDEKTPEGARRRTSEMADKAKVYLSQKIPQERRDQAIVRLRKMIVEIQSHPDYGRSIGTMLSLAEKYFGISKDVSREGVGSVKDFQSDDSVKLVEHNLRILIERFANSTSLDDVFGAIDNLYRDADEDPELRAWFIDMNSFTRRALEEKGWVQSHECERDWDKLYDRGAFLLRHRYKEHTTRVLDEIKFIGDQFAEDPQNKAFANSMQKLFADLGHDQGGKIVFKKHLLIDIRDVILPAVFREMRYVPVPRLEMSDPIFDVVVENIVIESDNLMPNVVELGSDNYFRWGRKRISNKKDNKIMIGASGIQADIRGISYYVRKKQGFPTISDKGVMDLFLGGDGFSFKIAASAAQAENSRHFFRVDDVKVHIHNVDIKLKKSKHKILFTLFKPILFSVVRPALEVVLRKQVRDAFVKGDELAYEIHREAKRAEEAAEGDAENKRTAYSRYIDAARARMDMRRAEEQKKAEKTEKKRGTKVQAPTTLHSTLFPDIALPGAISTRATAYEDLAWEGEHWESPVFNIGKAAQSSDIPKPAPITRKSHRTAESKRVEPHQTDGRAAANGPPSTTGPGGTYPARGFVDEFTSEVANGDSKKIASVGPRIQPGSPSPQAA